jgi:cation:H+ antiporter
MPLVTIILLIAGFVLLIYGADKLVDGASAIAKKYNIPEIVIGLTIVAFGTSAPELAINLVAAIKGNTDIVLGNVLGSNIFNVLLILGVSAIVTPLSVRKNTVRFEIPFSLIAALLVLFLASDRMFNSGINQIDTKDGIILLICFGFFLVYNFYLVRSNPHELQVVTKQHPLWKSLAMIFFGLGGLVLGGRLIVENAVTIAGMFGVSERVIALTIVSIGTSLPELATSLVAVRKKEVDIAIGNVVGSNIFNIFLVLGASAVAKNTIVSDISFTDIWINIVAGILLLGFVFRGKEKNSAPWEGRTLNKIEGAIFTVLYTGYIIYLITW